MASDNHPPRTPFDPGTELAARSASIDVLRQAMDSMQGHSYFAFLGDITRQAQQQLGYQGTLGEALRLLETLPDVEVEPTPHLAEHRVRWP